VSTVRSFLFRAALLVAAALAPQILPAQIAPGQSGTSSMTYVDGEEAMETLSTFGTCYAGRNTADALALIATEPGSTLEAQTYRSLFTKPYQTCLGFATELRAPLVLIRGAIAEGLYKRGIAIPSNLTLSAPPPGATIRTISEAARCYTATHDDQVRAIIAETKPGSRKEYEAIESILPDFMACVPEKARKLGFSVTQVRFRLAEALLRMALPASSTGAK
jgi:hypothetical protein